MITSGRLFRSFCGLLPLRWQTKWQTLLEDSDGDANCDCPNVHATNAEDSQTAGTTSILDAPTGKRKNIMPNAETVNPTINAAVSNQKGLGYCLNDMFRVQ